MSTVDLKTLGARLKQARLGAFLSQEDLATLLGVRRGSVARWEAGTRAISVYMLGRTADILGTTTTALTAPDDSTVGTMSVLQEVKAPIIPNTTHLHPLERESIEQVIAVLVERPELLPTVLGVLSNGIGTDGVLDSPDPSVVRRLQSIDINQLTPVAAFVVLTELRDLVLAKNE